MRAALIEDDSQVAEARRLAAAIAADIGFDETDKGRVSIVATELATNILKHAGRGELLLDTVEAEEGPGVEMMALDRGPGIGDLSAALRDGESTSGTAGNGLGAIVRQSDAFDIYSRRGAGAAVLARVHRHDPARKGRAREPASGAVNLPKPGEDACGDAWSVRRDGGGLYLMVVDGLGHGPLAATAAHEAVKVFETATLNLNADIMPRLHQALRTTRGAAASIAYLPDARGPIDFIGVGNVAGVLASDGEERRMVSHNGTLGHALKTARPFNYAAADDALVVLASDGLGTSWSLDAYPGLKQRHPSLIAGVLYRDFGRGRDDVTVLVGKRAAA